MYLHVCPSLSLFVCFLCSANREWSGSQCEQCFLHWAQATCGSAASLSRLFRIRSVRILEAGEKKFCILMNNVSPSSGIVIHPFNISCVWFSFQRSFRDDEMASLTSVMKRINLISDLRGRVRKACDCSFIHWHRASWCISVSCWISITVYAVKTPFGTFTRDISPHYWRLTISSLSSCTLSADESNKVESGSLARSSLRSRTRPFVPSYHCPFVHSSPRLFVPSYLRFFAPSCPRPCVHSSPRPFVPSYLRFFESLGPLVPPSLRSSVHSFLLSSFFIIVVQFVFSSVFSR